MEQWVQVVSIAILSGWVGTQKMETTSRIRMRRRS